MRMATLALLALLAISLMGCGEKPEDKGEIKSTASINNNAPGAADAPVAPRDPSIIMPDQVIKFPDLPTPMTWSPPGPDDPNDPDDPDNPDNWHWLGN